MDDVCPHPPQDYDHDPAQGVTTCGRCGQVMEENQLRNDHVFETTTTRKPTRYQPRQRNLNYDICSGASRLATMETARMELNTLAFRLKTAAAITTGAARFYALALDRHIHMGLRREVSLATCMYIQCRLENTPHLLYEFAECVGEDMASMHATYIRFCIGLRLQIPPMDPSVYLVRLASKLDFGDREEDIIVHGEAILTAMRKEWIDYGRRPYGVVAAALIIACGICGESRSVGQLSQMVMLTEATIIKRLNEFCGTGEAKQEEATGREVSAPPCMVQQATAPGLRRRIMSHEQRLARMRVDLMRMLGGKTGVPSPLTRSVWEGYWGLREETAGMCNALVVIGREVKDRALPVTAANRRECTLQHQVPMYEGVGAAPEFGEVGMVMLKSDVDTYAFAGVRMEQAALQEAVSRAKDFMGEGDDALSVSDWDPLDDVYMVGDTEEVARRKMIFLAEYQDHFATKEGRAAEEGSTNATRRKRTRGVASEALPFEASGPGEAAVVAMSRGVSSGINRDVLTEMLEGADDDDDIPLWQTVHIDK